MADRNRGDDGVVRRRTDVGADRGRRNHGCAGELELCAECVGRAAGARGGGGLVPAQGGAEWLCAVGWAKARSSRAVPTLIPRLWQHGGHASAFALRATADKSLCPPYSSGANSR